MPVPARLREGTKEAYAHSDALLEEERFAQAAEVLGEVIEPAALAVGSESKQVLALRRQRAAIRLLGGDYRAALPEFDALTDAYTRIAGPTSEQTRAQAARFRAELGQVTDALAAPQAVLNVVRAVGSDVSEEAVELRHNIGRQLPAQGQTAEAEQVLEPLRQDLAHGVRPGGRDDRRDRRGARRDPPRPRRFGFLTASCRSNIARTVLLRGRGFRDGHVAGRFSAHRCRRQASGATGRLPIPWRQVHGVRSSTCRGLAGQMSACRPALGYLRAVGRRFL